MLGISWWELALHALPIPSGGMSFLTIRAELYLQLEELFLVDLPLQLVGLAPVTTHDSPRGELGSLNGLFG